MIKFLVLILVIFTGLLHADSPDEAFKRILDAIYSADADCFDECLSTESTALINMMLVMVKMKPDEAAIEVSSQLGIEISAEELMGWTSSDLISTVLSSPGFVSELPAREEITVSGYETSGDSSLVFFTMDGYSETFQLLLVKNGVNWKLDQSVIQSML